jgi:hypothetical protein
MRDLIALLSLRAVMSSYDLFGSVNTVFIFISLYGVLSQVKTIWRRKVEGSKGGATELLSVNQFTVSYLAYLSFFIYGYSIEPFNHYIVWPRFIAATLIGIVLYEIWAERRTTSSLSSLFVAVLSLVLGVVGLIYGNTFVDEGKYLSTIIILVISLLIAQGYFHQIKLIITSGTTGAIDLKMSQFILMMDISTIAFALSMGIDNGWPLMVLAITSGITKIIIMYLFNWVRISPSAMQRRKISIH